MRIVMKKIQVKAYLMVSVLVNNLMEIALIVLILMKEQIVVIDHR